MKLTLRDVAWLYELLRPLHVVRRVKQAWRRRKERRRERKAFRELEMQQREQRKET